ncbi:MAG: tRNA dihydrouridine synthase DusB [Mangrovibacterium sp.]
MKIGKIDLGNVPLFLAPMEDVTYQSFRTVCKQNGADVMYTEFVSSEALVREVEKTKLKMKLDDADRPIGIQIYGYDINSMANAARMAEEMQPDFIDLNFGCPMKKIVKRGACSALLQDLPKMQAMAAEVVKGVKLPVTAKTRLGWDEETKCIMETAERLQDVGISALAIHGRTRSQIYSGTADWTLIGEVKNNPKITIPIIGNGDINGPEKAKELLNQTGVDGLMIGRGSIGRPWIFNEIKHYINTGELLPYPTVSFIVNELRKQMAITTDFKGNELSAIRMMRRHFARYFPGIYNFRPCRIKLLQADTREEVDQTLDEILALHGDKQVDYTNMSLK